MTASFLLAVLAVRLDCAAPGGWKLVQRTETPEPGVQVEVITLTSPVEATPPAFTASYALPQKDIHHTWRPSGGTSIGVSERTSLANWMPVYAAIDANSGNRLTVACSEAFHEVAYWAGIHEPTCEYRGAFTFFTGVEAPVRTAEVRLRFDDRPVFWGRAVEEASDWISSFPGNEPSVPPEAAFDPLYSSWYNFHQDVTASALEADLPLAAADGMRTVILDDGWQTERPGIGYSNCGDWTVARRFAPDMRRHVESVHRLGFRYMVWSAVPFMGEKAEAWPRFKGKFIRVKWGNVWVLDPRFPEVRKYLIDLYARRMREWNVDGFKLDFIEQFSFDESGDPAVRDGYAGRDIRSMPEAIDALMGGIRRKLVEIRPDVMIEYRQAYMGPAIRKFGNMIRVGDCPGDFTANRRGIANLRLTSGRTAVHSDMLEWHPEESAVSAARSIISALFGVVQYSMVLARLPEEHHRMVAHWVRFSQKHRDTLLNGEFRPYHPESDYPVLEGVASDERVVAVYSPSVVAQVAADRRAIVVNATGCDSVALDFAALPKSVKAFDAFGREVSASAVRDCFSRVACPHQGYLEFLFTTP